jgi:hypothetical protein
MTLARFALSLTAVALSAAALPARAACTRVCDDAYSYGGDTEERVVVAVPEPPRRRAPPVEATLPDYLWSKLRERTHQAVDATAYALIKATASVAVAVSAKDSEEKAHPAPAASPQPAAEPAAPCKRPPA